MHWLFGSRTISANFRGPKEWLLIKIGEMDASLTVAELFKKANLVPCGPVRWNKPIPNKRPGVYVIGLSPDANASSSEVNAEYLETPERSLWVPNQPIVYIGQATRQSLATRLGQFYRHSYGAKSPHRGGQALKLLTCDLWVYWCPCDNPRGCESLMLDVFRQHTGQLPFANRTRMSKRKALKKI